MKLAVSTIMMLKEGGGKARALFSTTASLHLRNGYQDSGRHVTTTNGAGCKLLPRNVCKTLQPTLLIHAP